MKNNKLSIFLIPIFLLAINTVKAQSIIEKLRSDMEQRKKYNEMVVQKAKEQQAQQQAEKRSDFNATVPAPNNANNPVQTNVQPGNVQQKDNVIKPSTEPNSKKPVTQQKVKSTAVPGKNE